MPGLLCAFSSAIEDNSDPAIFTKGNETNDDLFNTNIINIETNASRADKFIVELNRISTILIRTITLCHLSEINHIENYLYVVIRQSLERQAPTLNWLNNDNVKKVNDSAKKVSKEIHRFKGILRFSQLIDNTYFANFAPDHNIIIPLARHFKERLASEKWIIRDTGRKMAIAYENNSFHQLDEDETEELNSAIFANNELTIRKLWLNFFKSVAIPERKNPKLQQQLIPKRYWKYLTEKKHTET